MKVFILIALFLLVAVLQVSAIKITEIMYNPVGDDNNREYIEIYFDDGTANLSRYIIADASSSDIPKLVRIDESKYALIVEDGFDYTSIEVNIYSIGKAIGNTLNNGGDTVFLKDSSGKVIDTLVYIPEMGGNGDGSSLCLIDSKWVKCEATPGKENVLLEKNTSSTQINTTSIVTEDDSVDGVELGLVEGIKTEQNKEISSYLKVIEVSSLNFGGIGKAKINIYKGNTEKNSIRLWVENGFGTASETTSLNVYGKFVNITIIVPIMMNKCNVFIPKYRLVVDGLETKDSKDLDISGCNNEDDSISKDLNLEGNKEPDAIYESKKDKFSKKLLYFLLSAFVVLIIYFILTRKSGKVKKVKFGDDNDD